MCFLVLEVFDRLYSMRAHTLPAVVESNRVPSLSIVVVSIGVGEMYSLSNFLWIRLFRLRSRSWSSMGVVRLMQAPMILNFSCFDIIIPCSRSICSTSVLTVVSFWWGPVSATTVVLQLSGRVDIARLRPWMLVSSMWYSSQSLW